MEYLNNLKNIELAGNSYYQYLLALGLFLLVLVGLYIFKKFLVVRIEKLAQKTLTKLDDVLLEGIKKIHWPFFVLISLNLSLQSLVLASFIERALHYALLIAAVYYAIRILLSFVDYITKMMIAKRQESEADNLQMIQILSFVAKVLIWSSAVLLALSNLGYNITSLIAGLGIGGIAVALALQNILSDLFSSVSIYFDKPFKVGDFVVIGEHSGTIKRVGIKSTRIQALQGEEIVMSNNELTQARIQNYGLMARRRVVLALGVTYQTSHDKLKKIPSLLKQIVDKQKNATIDRSHFKGYGDFSLNFETIYYIESADYAEYMDIQEAVNLEIFKIFTKEKIDFAYPTQTVLIEK